MVFNQNLNTSFAVSFMVTHTRSLRPALRLLDHSVYNLWSNQSLSYLVVAYTFKDQFSCRSDFKSWFVLQMLGAEKQFTVKPHRAISLAISLQQVTIPIVLVWDKILFVDERERERERGLPWTRSVWEQGFYHAKTDTWREESERMNNMQDV